MKNLKRLFNTVKYLKSEQFLYRIWYKIRPLKLRIDELPKAHLIPLDCEDQKKGKLEEFNFLNIKHPISFPINWNLQNYGKLWVYNLNYFEFLNYIDVSQGIALMKDFINQYDTIKDGKEPYPISLRLINWVKFLSINNIEDKDFDLLIWKDVHFLKAQLEYHLLGNHLLENGYGLMFAAFYFKNDKLYDLASKILHRELNEEYQDDGAHFEQSPMYHFILQERILDLIAIFKKANWKTDLLPFLEKKASETLAYTEFIGCFKNWPLFNDSAYGISKTPKQLLAKSEKLNINYKTLSQGKSSGYRRIDSGEFALFFKAGPVGPDYQPGHAHADSLTFCLYYKSEPIIVDTGTSTYEKNQLRQGERSTLSHNTISYNNNDSSEVWGGFRVGNRAKVKFLTDSDTEIIASHNGYKNFGIEHQRKITSIEPGFNIEDKLKGKINNKSTFSLHFHPECNLELNNSQLLINNQIKINFEGLSELKIENYMFAPEFNKRIKAKKLIAKFENLSRFNIEEI